MRSSCSPLCPRLFRVPVYSESPPIPSPRLFRVLPETAVSHDKEKIGTRGLSIDTRAIEAAFERPHGGQARGETAVLHQVHGLSCLLLFYSFLGPYINSGGLSCLLPFMVLRGETAV